jgi:hypothetical protein
MANISATYRNRTETPNMPRRNSPVINDIQHHPKPGLRVFPHCTYNSVNPRRTVRFATLAADPRLHRKPTLPSMIFLLNGVEFRSPDPESERDLVCLPLAKS